MPAATRSWRTRPARRRARARVRRRRRSRSAARAPGSGRARRPRGCRRRGGASRSTRSTSASASAAACRGSRRRACPAFPPVTSSSASAVVSGAIRNCASPISSAKTPPGPNATSGPKIGSWTTPASSSAPPRTIGWTSTGSADPLDRRADRRPRREVEGDPAGLGLVRAGGGGLDDGREAELARRLDAPRPPSPRRAPATSGIPYASSSSRTCAGVSQASFEDASTERDERLGRRPVDALELGDVAGRPAQPLRAVGGVRRARGRPTPGSRSVATPDGVDERRRACRRRR